MDGLVYGWIGVWMDWCMNGLVYVCTGVCMYGCNCIDGWVYGWMIYI